MGVFIAALWAGILTYGDLKNRRLPDWLTIPALGYAILWAFKNGQSLALWGGVMWAGIYFLAALKGAGIGGGDIKLAASLGIFAWAAAGIWGLWVAIFLANLISLLAALLGRQKRVPHGPAMLLATAISLGLPSL
ncbi:prepilin peptidase [Corynebacterium caspium]|uniref:prepilin peptidase n=1 Tax=Corynebacterium caspium TaxID=234828 RepID=UPI0003809C86|nr:A24 family peptidase [Corynebacterium caspium]WKD59201.1 Type IV leader peptidase family protein [Corynebacterium caspium DSM 44850]